MAKKAGQYSKDNNKTPQQLYAEREKRIRDATLLKQPDCIPIVLGLGYLIAQMGGVTNQYLYENPDKMLEITEKILLQFQPDSFIGLFGGPDASKVLGDRMTKWPGYGLGPSGSFQFNEQEFMKEEDYEAFLEDMSDFAIRTYLPRAFSALEGLSFLPPLAMSLFGFYNLNSLAVVGAPPVAAALEAINKASQATLAAISQATASMQRTAAIGFPAPIFLFGTLIEAPFDFMSDTLRGMRGIFLDIKRNPDKLLAAEQKVLRLQVKHAVAMAKISGIPYAGIPLHRGSDGFMSLKDFEKFYWPQLKDMMLQLINAGITPSVFYEGVWDKRLKYLAELPKGKTIGAFQGSDIFRVKDVLGDTMCIMGGMPVSMLMGGTVEQVREHTKKLCEYVGKGGGYIMSTGVMELYKCRPELIKTWVDATREFGDYSANAK